MAKTDLIKAGQQAAKALKDLQETAPQNQWQNYPEVKLAQKIAANQQLTDSETAALETWFDSNPPSKDLQDAFLNNLRGGEPMRTHIQLTAETRRQNNAAVITACFTPETGQALKIGDKPPEEIKIIEIGDPTKLTETDRIQTIETLRLLAQQTSPMTAVTEWQKTTTTTLATDTETVLDSPDLHQLRRDISSALTDTKIRHQQTPWLPKTVVASWPTPPETVPDIPKIGANINQIRLKWGAKETHDFPLTQKPAVVTAAHNQEHILETHLNRTIRQLTEADQRWLTAIEAIIASTINTSLDKIGRTITRSTRQLADVTPTEAAIISLTERRELLADIDITSTISLPIQDAINLINSLTFRHAQTVARIISQNFSVTEPLDHLTSRIQTAAAFLADQLTHWIEWRATTPQGFTRVNNQQEAPPQPDPQLTRDYAAIAAGAAVTPADTETPIPKPAINFTTGLGIGLLGLTALTAAIHAWQPNIATPDLVGIAGANLPAVTLRPLEAAETPANVLAALTDLQNGGSQPPTILIDYRWTKEWYGPIKTVHNPEHIPHFGTIVENPQNVDNGPGSHRWCVCGWEPLFRFA